MKCVMMQVTRVMKQPITASEGVFSPFWNLVPPSERVWKSRDQNGMIDRVSKQKGRSTDSSFVLVLLRLVCTRWGV